MKALVLCAGRGTRLRPLTHTQAKAALPVAGRPVVGHILHYLSRHGFADVGVVISPGQEELRQVEGPAGQRLTFIQQARPLGIANAVAAAQDYLGQEPFLLYLGDNLTDQDLWPLLDRFREEGPDGLIAVRKVSDPQQFGVAVLDGDRITKVVEKPASPPSNLAIAGLYLFTSQVHQAIAHLQPSARGEYEITDAIARLVDDGGTVLAAQMTGWWQDMGTPEGMLAANILLLDGITTDISPEVSLDSAKIQGRVTIGAGTRLQNVRLRGPLSIGPGCSLTDAYVGPYTSIGANCTIVDASMENSILLPGCRLEGPSFHLEGSLLGRRAVIQLRSGRAATLLLGDDGCIQFPGNGR